MQCKPHETTYLLTGGAAAAGIFALFNRHPLDDSKPLLDLDLALVLLPALQLGVTFGTPSAQHCLNVNGKVESKIIPVIAGVLMSGVEVNGIAPSWLLVVVLVCLLTVMSIRTLYNGIRMHAAELHSLADDDLSNDGDRVRQAPPNGLCSANLTGLHIFLAAQGYYHFYCQMCCPVHEVVICATNLQATLLLAASSEVPSLSPKAPRHHHPRHLHLRWARPPPTGMEALMPGTPAASQPPNVLPSPEEGTPEQEGPGDDSPSGEARGGQVASFPVSSMQHGGWAKMIALCGKCGC